jgi:septal ring factor EnvC (AmiA/AmiB activator)
MKIFFFGIFLIVFVLPVYGESIGLPASQLKKIGDLPVDLTEKQIQLSREKIQLEIEAVKLRDLLAASEQRIKELVQSQKESEKELSIIEKELSICEDHKEKLTDQNSLFRDAVTRFNLDLKPNFPPQK